MLWLAVALGGALGAIGRYGVSVALAPQHIKFPVATLTVNILGSLMMGIFYVLIVEKAMLSQEWRHVIMIGFLGAFTTFSTFSIETLHLFQAGHWQTAVIYLGLSLMLCVLAVYLGITITDSLL
ncbi:fluoride efflux transporter CrcB [Teredinibacter haidensis]|uniref:fluoride efflux transporter CrcB n=1 Tax=Teredinibacter haidensis TaxID=2731755 RepID=UPI000948FB65|nr:fluoride efflux transporter CrcB [Teredinibacter haidensis]